MRGLRRLLEMETVDWAAVGPHLSSAAMSDSDEEKKERVVTRGDDMNRWETGR